MPAWPNAQREYFAAAHTGTAGPGPIPTGQTDPKDDTGASDAMVSATPRSRRDVLRLAAGMAAVSGLAGAAALGLAGPATRTARAVDDPATQRYICVASDCRPYVYDPAVGDPDSGIPPGTPFADLPDDWYCPICGAGKVDFIPLG